MSILNPASRTIKNLLFIGIIVVFCSNFPLLAIGSKPSISQKWYGVNRAGAEFTPEALPGVEGVDYEYPTDPAGYVPFSSAGLTLVRIPFLWERLQPQKMGSLDAHQVAQLTAVLDAAAKSNAHILLDLHNYGRYYNNPLRTQDGDMLADVWTKLLQNVGSHPALFGIELMNEPHDLPDGAAGWQNIVQNTVTKIRETNTSVTIVVPGYSWQSARFWQDNNKNLVISDPSNNLLYGAHQYFDDSFTGTYDTKVAKDPEYGAEVIKPFTDWLTTNGLQGIITEYGAPKSDVRALQVMNTMLRTVDRSSVLVGALYWASGPRWGDYPLSVEPTANGVSTVQSQILNDYPSRANPAQLPKLVRVNDFVKFKNNPTVFLVETDGLRPFSTFARYDEMRKKNSKAKLYTRTDSAEDYTIRWRSIETPSIME